ncbi:MAG: hypothetical protein OXC54_11685 [Rhodospirillaceae bacterium]|nr:hypothetical protein [Rhodospirillaceae bacterium]MCY4311948.1 hypothetical protein [Rhodospirillaceae bacterium]
MRRFTVREFLIFTARKAYCFSLTCLTVTEVIVLTGKTTLFVGLFAGLIVGRCIPCIWRVAIGIGFPSVIVTMRHDLEMIQWLAAAAWAALIFGIVTVNKYPCRIEPSRIAGWTT